MPVTCGFATREDFVPDSTVTILPRLDAAGSMHLGALNVSDFAAEFPT